MSTFATITKSNTSNTTLIDSCDISHFDSITHMRITGGIAYIGMGQSFTTIVASLLNSVTFDISKSGSPTGNITASIYAHSGTFGVSSIPTGIALATSNPIDVSTLTQNSTIPVLVTFTFSGTNQILLAANTYYVVTMNYTGTSDSSNQIIVGFSGNSFSAGNMSRLLSTTWASVAADLIFYIYSTTWGTINRSGQTSNIIIGNPIGLLLALTYAANQSSGGVNFTTINKS